MSINIKFEEGINPKKVKAIIKPAEYYFSDTAGNEYFAADYSYSKAIKHAQQEYKLIHGACFGEITLNKVNIL